MELSEKQRQYYQKWEKRRQHKVRYFLVHGVLLRGLVFGLLLELISSGFTLTYFDGLEFLLYFGIGALLGLVGTYFQYRRIERDYKNLKEKGLL